MIVPIYVTIDGIDIVVNAEQPENDDSPILLIFGSVIDVNGHPENTKSPYVVIVIIIKSINDNDI